MTLLYPRDPLFSQILSQTAHLILCCQHVSHGLFFPLAWNILLCNSHVLGPQGHSPNSSRMMVTTAELEPLAWAWAVPAENPFIWALTLALLPEQTPGTRKVPWVPLVAMVPGRVRRETLAPDSGRPDGVTTEPTRMWFGHPQVSELHPRGTWEWQAQRALHSVTHVCNPASHQLPTGFRVA